MNSKFNLLGEINKTNILASIYDGILITDHAGKVVFANPAMEEISGSLREAMIGKQAADILTFTAKDKTPNNLLADALEGWRAVKVDKGEFRGRGSVLPVQIIVSPIYGEGIDLAGLMIVVKNANEGKPTKRKLSSSGRRGPRSKTKKSRAL
jgi:PAS domain S-box-containing protein